MTMKTLVMIGEGQFSRSPGERKQWILLDIKYHIDFTIPGIDLGVGMGRNCEATQS